MSVSRNPHVGCSEGTSEGVGNEQRGGKEEKMEGLRDKDSYFVHTVAFIFFISRP